MPEPCALSFELALIAAHGRKNLCNLSNGGEGVSGITEEQKKKKSKDLAGPKGRLTNKTVYDWYHVKYGKITCIQFMIRKISGLPSSVISRIAKDKGDNRSYNGWSLYKNKDKAKGKSGPNRATINTIETYINDNGMVWTGNPYDFCVEFNLNKVNLYKMRTGRTKKYKGWSIAA